MATPLESPIFEYVCYPCLLRVESHLQRPGGIEPPAIDRSHIKHLSQNKYNILGGKSQ